MVLMTSLDNKPAPGKPEDLIPSQNSMEGVASKGLSLLFGILLFLTLFGLAETILMLSRGKQAGLIELLIFGLLAIEAAVLLLSTREKIGQRDGIFGYLSVWALGIIPYFVWGALYWLGKRIAGLIQRRQGKPQIIALLLWIGIILICAGVFLFTGNLSENPGR